MKLLRAISLGSLLAAASAADELTAQRVAIIGAGAAGSSAAYHLRKFADEAGVAVNISVFERSNRIGGRSLTVDAYDDPTLPVELGASIFVKMNQILWNATETFNLSLVPPGGEYEGLLGIWDGENLVYTQDEASYGWWNMARLFWKYGTAPYWANKLVNQVIGKFLNLYDAPYFPFRSLTTRTYELELADIITQTGQQMLQQHKVAMPFCHDIIQAATRVNYGSNLARIHGLDAMVAIAPQGASQVEGGNWQIFANFVNASNAVFYNQTSVVSISLAEDSKPETPKYVLETKTIEGEGDDKTTMPNSFEFDNVIVAAPLQFTAISAGDGVLQQKVDKVPYVILHVTLFASELPLRAEFFNLPPGAAAPTTVLTTLGPNDNADSGMHGAGKAGFFSISTLRFLTNPVTNKTERIYKIFSPQKVTPEFLKTVLDTGAFANLTEPEDDKLYSWYYPHVFHAYPQALPRVTFQDPILGNGLYYTAGMESFISTMETSALSGMNVARLIVDGMQGLQTGGAIPKEVEEAEEAKPAEAAGEL